MPTLVSGVTVLRDACEAINGVAASFATVGTTTAAGNAGGTTLVDGGIANLGGTSLLDGWWVQIDELVSGGPAVGERRAVNTAGWAGSTGTITVLSAFSAQVKTGTDYSLWAYIDPLRAFVILQRCLRLLRRLSVIPVTLVTNGDISAVTSGAGADNWTYTNCTVTGTTGYSSTAARVRHGKYALRASATGGAPTVESAALRVKENDQYVAAAAVMCDVGEATLTAYNSTASAAISGATATHNEEDYMLLLCGGGGSVSIPSGCETMTVRLTGTAATDDFYMDDVVVWPVNRRSYDLPSWVEDPGDVEAIGYYQRGNALVGTNAYALDEGNFVEVCDVRRNIDEGAATHYRVILPRPNYYPLFLRAHQPYAALTSLTDETTADRETLSLLVQWFIADALGKAAAARGNTEELKGWFGMRDLVGKDARLGNVLSRYQRANFKARALEVGYV